MASVQDVAEYILQAQGEMPPMQLQELVYYAQVWWCVADDEPLFSDPIRAWAQGPVVASLHEGSKGHQRVSPGRFGGNAVSLTARARAKLDEVLAVYGGMAARYLGELTRFEQPWKDARALELDRHEPPVITLASIRSFYGGRDPEELDAAYQLAMAEQLMDEHAACLGRLAR